MVEVPNKHTIPAEVAERIEALARTWRELQPRTEAMRQAQRSYDEDFLIRMAYNSNAIEGSTLTLADTEIVYEGEFVPGKPGREQVAARGIFEGAAFMDEVVESGRQLDETTLRDLHEQCALDLQPAARGMYRTAPAIIRASRTTPVAPAKIRGEMQNLFYQYKAYVDDAHPLEAVAWFHAALESVHPFADGNGRTGRLWMNAQLQMSAYPPIAIKVDHSAEYKAGLEAWQVGGEPAPFCSLFADAVEEELSRRIGFLSQGSVASGGPEGGISHGVEALGVIGMQPSITAKRLGSILGVSERQAQRVMGQLKDAGLLTRNGVRRKGTWVVTERGRSA